MKLHFTISEICILKDPVPQDVADKLLKYHIMPMNAVREMLGKPITASQKAGYRPKHYEIQRGRSGNSQHCFEGTSLGAVDWTCSDPEALLALILAHTDYKRVCYYPNNGFIHCDYKETGIDKAGHKRYFECQSPISSWEFIKYVSNR